MASSSLMIMHSSVHRIHARRSTSIGGVDAAASRPANQLINFTNHITAMQVNEKPDNQVNQPNQQSMTSTQIKSPKLRTRKALIPRTKIPRPRPRALAHPPQPNPDKRSRRKVNRPSHSPPEIPAPGAISPTAVGSWEKVEDIHRGRLTAPSTKRRKKKWDGSRRNPTIAKPCRKACRDRQGRCACLPVTSC